MEVHCLACNEKAADLKSLVKILGDSGIFWVCEKKPCHKEVPRLIGEWGILEFGGTINIEGAPQAWRIPFKNTQRDLNSLPAKIYKLVRKWEKTT